MLPPLILTAGAAASTKTEENVLRGRIWFLNVSTEDLCGDCTLLESDGRWGLIDGGHRFQTEIADADGTILSCPARQGLSCQAEGKYGESIAAYLTDVLGVTHLDFVLATHSHSDHIGGIPGIAEHTFAGPDGEPRHLVDESTVYFYKPFYHVNAEEDDLGEESLPIREEPITHIGAEPKTRIIENSWHDQAFSFQALRAMEARGCVLAELSGGVGPDETGVLPDFGAVTECVRRAGALRDFRYSPGDPENRYDDCVSFGFGAVEMRFYNLFPRQTSRNENVNSVVAVLSDGAHTAVLAGDVNVEQQTEQKIAGAIRADLGTVELLKAAHHGASRYSNARASLDALQPKFCVAAGNRDPKGAADRDAFACVRAYASGQYGTAFYEVGAGERGMMAELRSQGIALYTANAVEGELVLSDPSPCLYESVPDDGWACWQNDYPPQYTPAAGDWMYFLQGRPLTGWAEENGSRYYFDEQGLLLTGLQEINGKSCYLWTSPHYGQVYGSRTTGWLRLAEGQYYFFEDGTPARGWQQLDGKRYFFGADGAACTGWSEIDGEWYLFGGDGAMRTGWQEETGPDGQRSYFLQPDGAMVTGWRTVTRNGRSVLCYFGSDGALRLSFG